jgi:hypothetical protein
VAFSFLLLVTAALFLRSIGQAYGFDPGFQTAHLAVFMANPAQAGYNRAQSKQFYKDARERVAAIPGVETAAWASNLPLWARAVNGLRVEGRQQRSQSDTLRTILTSVDPGYFGDRRNHKRIQLPGETEMREIVGIAHTANYGTWREAPQACVYVPFDQYDSDGMSLFVRSKSNPRDLLMPVEREVQAAGPQVLVTGVRTGAELVDGGLFQAKVGVGLLSVFGLLALGLASIGCTELSRTR